MTRQEMWPVYYSVIKEFFLSQFNSVELKELIESVEKINSQFNH